MVLLALSTLGMLIPAAQAMPSDTGCMAASGDDCCLAPMLSICEQKSAAGHALTPSFSASITQPHGWQRLLPRPREAASPDFPIAQAAGPPAYLRYHRFLL